MFTIRIDHDPEHREVVSGVSYAVDYGEEACELTVRHHDAASSAQGQSKFTLKRGAVAHVMNAAGNTVDRIQVRGDRRALRA